MVPQLLWTGELVQRDFFFEPAISQRFVAEDEAVPVAGKGKGHTQQAGIFNGLRHASTSAMVVVFGLNSRNWNVGLEE